MDWLHFTMHHGPHLFFFAAVRQKNVRFMCNAEQYISVNTFIAIETHQHWQFHLNVPLIRLTEYNDKKCNCNFYCVFEMHAIAILCSISKRKGLFFSFEELHLGWLFCHECVYKTHRKLWWSFCNVQGSERPIEKWWTVPIFTKLHIFLVVVDVYIVYKLVNRLHHHSIIIGHGIRRVRLRQNICNQNSCSHIACVCECKFLFLAAVLLLWLSKETIFLHQQPHKLKTFTILRDFLYRFLLNFFAHSIYHKNRFDLCIPNDLFELGDLFAAKL